jgi:hypothetical protein
MSLMDAEKYLVRKPLGEVGLKSKTTGRQSPSQTYLSNTLVPGSNTYIEFGWIYDMPNPNPHIYEHVHDYDEIVIHIGSDAKNPENLGGEIEYCFNGEPLVFDTTTVLFVPRGTRHGPLTWKKVTRPHIEMSIMLGCGDFEKAAPGRTSRK